MMFNKWPTLPILIEMASAYQRLYWKIVIEDNKTGDLQNKDKPAQYISLSCRFWEVEKSWIQGLIRRAFCVVA